MTLPPGLGKHAEQFAGQADAAPAQDDRNGDVRGAVLLGWLIAGDATPRRLAVSTATSANRLA